MGTDKALLTLDGKTLLERAADAVREAAGSVAIIGSPERYGRFGYTVLPDIFHGLGPLAGIHTALTRSNVNWNLIVACDMPGLETRSVSALLDRTGRYPDADVLIPYADRRLQPLCAVYHRRALPHIAAALHAGRLKIMDAIADLRIVRLPMSDLLFRNVNTPEEWKALAAR